MTPERWERVGMLFDRALAEPAATRVSWVGASSEPADVRDEVLSLLETHVEGGFLEPPSLLEAGAQIGPYRIAGVLGRGGMGVVYLAEDTRLHRPVALKALPPHLFRDERMRSRLRYEARAAAALSHPAIATVFALEEIGDQLFIASEYLEGRTLRQELEEGPLPFDRAVATALDIGRALLAAHQRGIVHRDLKPENIVRTASGAVKVLDFGLAQFDLAAQDLASVTRLTELGVIAGTPPYMAPEQLLGQPTSARTDQFAFGVLLYELLTGRHPFGGGALPAMIARVLAADPDPAAEIPPAVWTVLERALQKRPDDRFADTTDLVRALEHLGPLGTPGPPSLAHQSPASFGEVTPKRPLAAQADTPVQRESGGLKGWWETHQLIVALAYWSVAWPSWSVHKWTGRYGVLIFLATLTAIIVAGNLRLHLWFTSRTYPTELTAQRDYVSQWIRAADYAFALILVATGLMIADAHTGWGALFVSFGLGAALAFLFIEPTTARAAFQGGGRPNLGDETGDT